MQPAGVEKDSQLCLACFTALQVSKPSACEVEASDWRAFPFDLDPPQEAHIPELRSPSSSSAHPPVPRREWWQSLGVIAPPGAPRGSRSCRKGNHRVSEHSLMQGNNAMCGTPAADAGFMLLAWE
eukprot:1142074-Pelagomonas_calceolata.AAC.7